MCSRIPWGDRHFDASAARRASTCARSTSAPGTRLRFGLPGPIGAILNPQLRGVGSEVDASLPYASLAVWCLLRGVPVRIDIPEVLVDLRTKVVEAKGASAEGVGMGAMGWLFGSAGRLGLAQRAATLAGRLSRGRMPRNLRGHCPAGPMRATYPHPHRRPSATGGCAPMTPMAPGATGATDECARRDAGPHSHRQRRGRAGPTGRLVPPSRCSTGTWTSSARTSPTIGQRWSEPARARSPGPSAASSATWGSALSSCRPAQTLTGRPPWARRSRAAGR